MDIKTPIQYKTPHHKTRPAHSKSKPGFVRSGGSDGMLAQGAWASMLQDPVSRYDGASYTNQKLQSTAQFCAAIKTQPSLLQQNIQQSSEPLPAVTIEPQKPLLNRFLPKPMTGFAALLIISGLASLVVSLRNNHAVSQQVKALSRPPTSTTQGVSDVSLGSGDIPTEDKPSDSVVSKYSVAATHPKYIQISKLGGYKSRVLSVGLTEDGAIAAPRSVWDAGWYNGSSSPTDKVGAALIAGHVAGPTTSGIFYNLHLLEIGDDITLTMGDDSLKAYTVVAKEEAVAEQMNMNTYLVSKNIDKPGLNLITCGGDFDPKTNSYDKRTVIFAVVKG